MNAKKPSVMMIISQFRPVASGAELQAERLAYKLADLGFPLQVLTQHLDPVSPSHEVYRGVKIHRSEFQLAYKLTCHDAAPTLQYLINKHRTYDILHNHQIWGHAVVSTLVARWLGKKNIIKLACAGTFGDLEVFSQLRHARWGLRVLQMADALIAVSQEIKSELLQHGFDPAQDPPYPQRRRYPGISTDTALPGQPPAAVHPARPADAPERHRHRAPGGENAGGQGIGRRPRAQPVRLGLLRMGLPADGPGPGGGTIRDVSAL